jgi:integrase
VVHVRAGKQKKQRQVPLHPSTVAALRAYAGLRDARCPTPSTPAFFLSARGRRMGREELNATFITLVHQVGLEGAGARARPRPHDLRHAFAVHTLLDWYRTGEDIDRRMPLLSTYLGHVDPTKGSQTVFAGHRACGVCRAGCRWPGGVASAPVVRAMLQLTGGPAGVVVERDPQVDLDSPAGDAHVVDGKA